MCELICGNNKLLWLKRSLQKDYYAKKMTMRKRILLNKIINQSINKKITTRYDRQMWMRWLINAGLCI
jgi:hypothetical protein